MSSCYSDYYKVSTVTQTSFTEVQFVSETKTYVGHYIKKKKKKKKFTILLGPVYFNPLRFHWILLVLLVHY